MRSQPASNQLPGTYCGDHVWIAAAIFAVRYDIELRGRIASSKRNSRVLCRDDTTRSARSVNETLGRLTLPPDADSTPRVCLLDSGVNRAHPLLAPLIDGNDLHTVNPGWGTNDTANHGTGLAGLALFGDLSETLATNDPLLLAHRLESVKLTPEQGANQGDAKQHGYLFAEAVSRPEVAAPNRPRVFTSAVTSDDGRDRGRPSAWSATVDKLASDYDFSGESPRLFVLSAGNTTSEQAWSTYPAVSQLTRFATSSGMECHYGRGLH